MMKKAVMRFLDAFVSIYFVFQGTYLSYVLLSMDKEIIAGLVFSAAISLVIAMRGKK